MTTALEVLRWLGLVQLVVLVLIGCWIGVRVWYDRRARRREHARMMRAFGVCDREIAYQRDEGDETEPRGPGFDVAHLSQLGRPIEEVRLRPGYEDAVPEGFGVTRVRHSPVSPPSAWKPWQRVLFDECQRGSA